MAYLLYDDILEEAAEMADLRTKWAVPIQTAVRHGFAGENLPYLRHRVNTSSWVTVLSWDRAPYYRDVQCGATASTTIARCLGVRLTDSLNELEKAFLAIADEHGIPAPHQNELINELREIANVAFVRHHSHGTAASLHALAVRYLSPAGYRQFFKQ